MSKKKNVIARVGNFEITKDSGAEHDYLRIKAISGSWGITHRDDSQMYGAWLMMCTLTMFATCNTPQERPVFPKASC